jgi:hypothetical protein
MHFFSSSGIPVVWVFLKTPDLIPVANDRGSADELLDGTGLIQFQAGHLKVAVVFDTGFSGQSCGLLRCGDWPQGLLTHPLDRLQIRTEMTSPLRPPHLHRARVMAAAVHCLGFSARSV